MLEEEIVDYYTNWNEKIKLIKGTEAKDVYDRFISLYPIQNKLYRKASELLIAKGKIANDGGDKQSATVNVVMYLGGKEIIDEFVAKENQTDINYLIQILENRLFNIILTRKCESISGSDQALLGEMRSANNNVRATAVLKMIYHVRCNYVHGCKDYHEIQTLLLEPINNLLITLNSFLYNKLSE